jgi:glutamate--cysteine ligase
VRCMDLDPFEPVGIGADTMRVLDVFLLHCLLADSPPDSPGEIARLARNQHRAAAQGRDPALKLERDGGQVRLIDWAREVLHGCQPIADAVDAAQGSRQHAQALARATALLDAPERLPSARVLDTMARDFERSFTAFMRAQSASTRSVLLRPPLASETIARFEAEARLSLAEQQRIEAADTLSFEEWRQAYLAPERLVV